MVVVVVVVVGNRPVRTPRVTVRLQILCLIFSTINSLAQRMSRHSFSWSGIRSRRPSRTLHPPDSKCRPSSWKGWISRCNATRWHRFPHWATLALWPCPRTHHPLHSPRTRHHLSRLCLQRMCLRLPLRPEVNITESSPSPPPPPPHSCHAYVHIWNKIKNSFTISENKKGFGCNAILLLARR